MHKDEGIHHKEVINISLGNKELSTTPFDKNAAARLRLGFLQLNPQSAQYLGIKRVKEGFSLFKLGRK